MILRELQVSGDLSRDEQFRSKRLVFHLLLAIQFLPFSKSHLTKTIWYSPPQSSRSLKMCWKHKIKSRHSSCVSKMWEIKPASKLWAWNSARWRTGMFSPRVTHQSAPLPLPLFNGRLPRRDFDTLIAPLSKWDPNRTQARAEKVFSAKTLTGVDGWTLKGSLPGQRSRENFHLEPWGEGWEAQ